MRLVHGWGINDADYPVRRCPIYIRWTSMLARCYCSKTQADHMTYVGCRVDERWKYFMTFRAWYLEQNPKSGAQLDKDFLGDGKLYSPEICCFVPACLNKLFNNHGAKRGKCPQGVYYHKTKGKYIAQIRIKDENIHLGVFDTPEEASAVYLKSKAVYVEELLIEFPQSLRLAAAIRRKMMELIEQEMVAA